MVQSGTINMETTNIQSFDIPAAVPETACEVLVYVYVIKGTATEYSSNMKIYTESNMNRRFEKYLHIYTYPQSAVSTVSENMFLPVTSDRKIHVRLTRTHPGNVSGYVYIIGYR